MKSSGIKTSTVLASFLLAACLSMHAEVKLPAIFSDGMVMQQPLGNGNSEQKSNSHYRLERKTICSNSRQKRLMETFSLHSGSRRTVYHHFRRWNPKDTE